MGWFEVEPTGDERENGVRDVGPGVGLVGFVIDL